MTPLQRQNIRGKLTLVLWGAALLAFVAAAVGLLVYQSLTTEQRARQIMEPYAQLVSVGTEGAVVFEDPQRAQEVLDTLRGNPQILEASIFLEDGRRLASFSHRPNATPKSPPNKPVGVYVDQDTAELIQALPRDARLRLTMGLDQLSAQTHQALWVFGAGVLVLLTITLAQLTVLHRTIVRPIASLTETAELVRAQADYRHRVPSAGTDEIARLGQSFNDMLGVIQERENDLRRLTFLQRTILDNAAYGIVSTAADGMVTSLNPAAERLLGYTSNEVVGKLTPACWHDEAEIARRALQLSDELGETIPAGFEVFSAHPQRNLPEEREWTFILKNGTRVPVLLSISALRGEHGQITGFVGLFYDLTEHRQAEEERRRYKDQLEETVQRRTAELLLARDAAEAANKAKSVFLANMSHELRTPLNAILGFSRMMRRSPHLSEDHSESLDIINRSGEHLLTLINDVLEMAKIEAGRVQLEATPFDLGYLIRDVADMMQLRAEEKGLYLRLDQSSEFPRHINGDEARIRQILVNLVSNAVKFTEQGGVIIRLSTKRNARCHLLIEVEDSGPGISPEDRQRVFKPFVQLAEGGDQIGTGLGLAITRQFVDLMGGSITIESTPGKGSLFRVELPVEPLGDGDLPPQHTELGEVAGLAPGQPSYRILIAEDQHENRLLLDRLMTDIGLETRVVENGEQCVEVFQAWHPDLIWMDRRMPILDGEEATRRIRQLPGGGKVKIVAVTASAFKEQQQEMFDAGMNDFVGKPYRFGEIYTCLARQLDLKYVYRSPLPEEQAPAMVLTRELLATLPASLRQELKGALEALDSERIATLIQQVGDINAELGRALSHLAKNFDYGAILNTMAS